MNTLLILLCVAVLSHTDVSDAECYACKKGAPVCNTPFSPSGPELQACGTLHLDLCRKYGDYKLSCGYGTALSSGYIQCTVSCDSPTRSTPSMTTLLLTSAVLTLFMKSM